MDKMTQETFILKVSSDCVCVCVGVCILVLSVPVAPVCDHSN